MKITPRINQIMTPEKNKEKPAGKKTVLRRITGIIGYVIIFLIAALFVFVISFKANNQTLFIFGKAAVWVMTPSMEPTIPERSYILIEKADPDSIKVGDVIMFKSMDPALNGANNTHRVVEISEDRKSFTTKGDANAIPDSEPARAENVIGVYVKNLPALSAVGRFLFSGIGIIITMTLIFVIIMIIYLPDIIRATREKSKQLEEKRQAQIADLVRAEVERLKRENEATPEEAEVSDTPEAEKGPVEAEATDNPASEEAADTPVTENEPEDTPAENEDGAPDDKKEENNTFQAEGQ